MGHAILSDNGGRVPKNDELKIRREKLSARPAEKLSNKQKTIQFVNIKLLVSNAIRDSGAASNISSGVKVLEIGKCLLIRALIVIYRNAVPLILPPKASFFWLR